MEKHKFDLQFFAEDPENNGGEPGKEKEPDKKTTEDKTFSQADLDRLVKERLERERKKFADYDELKKAKDELEELKKKDLSELERERQEKEAIKAEKARVDAEIAALKVEGLKSRLVLAAGLPLELVDRVRGTTEEEIKADIEQVKKFLKPTSVGAPTNPGTQKDESDEARGKRFAEERAKKSGTQEGYNPWGAKG